MVCGYIEKAKGVTSIVLGQYDQAGKLQYKGHVTLGVGGASFQKILKMPRRKTPPFAVPAGNETADWIRPKLVCTVKYMMKTQKGGMRQPVFKGLRDDKMAEECLENK